MRGQEHFDVNRILKISVGNFSETSYVWFDETPKTNFFGFKTKKIIEAGWRNLDSIFDDSRYTTEELLEKGYILHENKIKHKPYVKIYIDFEYTFTKKFDTLEECFTYCNHIKSLTNKVFEIIEY